MRHVLSLFIAFCFLGITIDLVHADNKPAVVTKTKKMPVQKARLLERAALLSSNLQAAIKKSLEENPEFMKIQEKVKRAQEEAQAVAKEFNIGPEDTVDFDTGEITRPQKPAAAPATDKPEKTAKAEKK